MSGYHDTSMKVIVVSCCISNKYLMWKEAYCVYMVCLILFDKTFITLQFKSIINYQT